MNDIISFLKKKKKNNLAEKDFNINTDFSWKKIIN